MLDQMDLDAPEQDEMSFFDHIEVLRWHLVRSAAALLIMTIVSFIAKSFIFGIIEAPRKIDFWTYRKLCELGKWIHAESSLCIESIDFKLVNMEMAGQFTQHITISFAAGIVLSFPYIFWEMWRFVKPALKGSEKRFARGVVFFSSLLFALGVLCGYFFLVPVSVQFLANYTLSEGIENTITISNYISLITMITFATSIVFELPIVVFFLTKVGIITPQVLRAYRKHAVVVILLISAILTPPDVTSQIMLGIPFFALYELSIFVSVWVSRSHNKERS